MKRLSFFLLLGLSCLIDASPDSSGVREVAHDRSFQAPTSISSLAFSGDGEWLAAAGNLDETVTMWRLGPKQPSGRCLEGVRSVSFSSDSRLLAAAGHYSRVLVHNANGIEGEEPEELWGHHDWVNSVAFSPTDSKLLASAGYDATVLLWNMSNKKNSKGRREPVGSMVHHTRIVRASQFSPDGKHLISGCNDGTGLLWDVEREKTVGSMIHSQPKEVDFMSDGRCHMINSVAFGSEHAVTGGQDGVARLWDSRKRDAVMELCHRLGPVNGVAISPRGHVVTAGGDGTARSWDLRRTKRAAHLLRHARQVHAIEFNSQNDVASAGDDGVVKLVKKHKPRVKRQVSFREQ